MVSHADLPSIKRRKWNIFVNRYSAIFFVKSDNIIQIKGHTFDEIMDKI